MVAPTTAAATTTTTGTTLRQLRRLIQFTFYTITLLMQMMVRTNKAHYYVAMAFDSAIFPKPPTQKASPLSLASSSSSSVSSVSSSPSTKPALWTVVNGPDPDTKPDYKNIHGPLGKIMDNIFLMVFRTQLAKKVGVDSGLPKEDYQGLMELTVALNARYSDRSDVQRIAQDTLRSLFPSWLPSQFAILFSKPFPEFSSRLNAWATKVAGTWLMGECEINDVEIDGKLYRKQGLLVKRCRFLEESGCASVCVNSCKIPTQQFFADDMGLPLTMTPDYETHECQFSFGLMPNEAGELDAKNTPCLARCPTNGGMRKWHQGIPSAMEAASGACSHMDNTGPAS